MSNDVQNVKEPPAPRLTPSTDAVISRAVLSYIGLSAMFLFIACLLRFAFGGNAISVILSAILGGTITFLALRALAKWADPDADAEMAWLTLISGAGWPLF